MSSGLPYPFSTAHFTPLIMTLSRSLKVNLNFPLEPTPEGIFEKSLFKSSSTLFCISSFLKFVLSNLTPQFISYPTPPGDITPLSTSKAATPPIGNPYPQ